MVVHHQFVPAASYGLFHTVKNLNCWVILSQCQEFSSCAKSHERISKKSITALHEKMASKGIVGKFKYAGAWLKILSCRPVTRGQCREMFLSLLVCLL